MVLIIRNNRIQSRRHSKIKNLLSCFVPKDKKKLTSDKDKETTLTMSSTARTLSIFFLYSVAMFTLPFIAFFGVKHILTSDFHADVFVTNSVSAVAAVVVVYIIIGVYAYRALHEPEEPSQPTADDDSDSVEEPNKKTD